MSISTPDSSREALPAEIVRLFPLSLSAFEHFMLLEDRPRWPMTFTVQLSFRGTLDKGALELAVRQTVHRHPLLRALVVLRRGRPHWELIEPAPCNVRWLSETDVPRMDRPARMDLEQGSGWRVAALAGSSDSRVWLQFHHACCDGQGARRVIVDLLTGYSRATSAQHLVPQWDELDWHALRTRDVFAAAGTALQATTTVWEKVRGAYHFHVLTPQPLAARMALGSSPADTVYRELFDPPYTKRIREQARLAAASVNDVGLTLLFQTLADWNRRQGGRPGHRLRIMMPTDLRTTRDDALPAANRMSYSFIARTLRQCQSVDELLPGVRTETQYIKRVRIGLDFLGGMRAALRVPGLVPLAMRRPSCLATAVLTNLGDPTRRFRRRFPSAEGLPVIGDVRLDAIFGIPPIRPRTHASFGMCVCAGKLSLCMQGDAEGLGGGQAELFADYVGRWRRFADGDCSTRLGEHG